MTREEAIKTLKENYCAMCAYGSQHMDSCDIRSCDNKDAIKALEQEPRKDEVILTKEEYGEIVSSEFDNGYAKGYREALEQEPIIDKIRAEIDGLTYYWCEVNPRTVIDDVIDIIDKHMAKEDKE